MKRINIIEKQIKNLEKLQPNEENLEQYKVREGYIKALKWVLRQ